MSLARTKNSPGMSPWGLGMLHGPSQIFFQKNMLTGLLVLAAFFVADWKMGALALIGCVGGMLGGRAVRFPLSSVADGMLSFCGVLVGAAVFATLGGNEWWSYAFAFAGGLATGPVTWAINTLFASRPLKRFNLPYTTAPFVIVATAIAVATPHLAVAAPTSVISTDPVPALLASLLTNVSQVVLIDNLWSGALILLGLFVADRRVGMAALLGSALGSLTAVAMGEAWHEIASGLANYAGVLTAIALAVTFLRSGVASWLYTLPWIVVTALVTLVMHRLGLDTYTWPYILTTWVALIVATYTGRLKRA